MTAGSWRRGGIAVARALNAAFLLSIAAFCFLSYSPFAYAQFIKPNVVPDLNDFVVLSPWLLALTTLITILTLMPQLRDRRAPGAIAARGLVAASLVAAGWALWQKPLITIGNSLLGLIIGLGALSLPVALAAVDHRVWPAPSVRPFDRRRLIVACLVAGVIAWLAYAAAAPLRHGQAVGIDLPIGGALVAAAASLAEDLRVFAIVLVLLLAVSAAAARAARQAETEYWLIIGLLAAATTLVCYFLVCASLAFTGRDAWIASAAFGLAIAALWSDLARLRAQSLDPPRAPGPKPSALSPSTGPQLDTLSLFAAPLTINRQPSRINSSICLAALPLVAWAMASAVAHLDWDFLLQKLTVLPVWLAAFAVAVTVTRRPRSRGPVVAAVAAFAVAAAAPAAVARAESRRTMLERYAVLDPSFRLIRDLQVRRSADTVAYYTLLRSHTLIDPRALRPLDVDFVQPLGPASVRPVHVFLIIIDSLRRDYLSSYNPAVVFTPAIAKFAAESVVFERAFTRYAGTALAVPSIWAGGMTIHTLEQHDFTRRNTLLKLLDANRYQRIMDFDHLIEELLPKDAGVVALDRGKGTMDLDLCATLTELQARVREREPDRPVFFYALPQNVHIAVATRRRVPANPRYNGFFAPIASELERIDGCFGSFVDALKASGLYDDSVIVLTSDHGDSLGEEGRWGHAYFMVPEVMRIPLIVHLPSRLRQGVTVDRQALAFSTDITPSLYALLGYQPADLGPLFGHPLFVRAGTARRRPETDGYLVASSYGAVYGLLRDNGQRLDVVDAVDSRDAAYDMSAGLLGHRVEETPAEAADTRRAIAAQLSALATLYGYHPEH